ncbi:hypothetical protein B0J14DRAFT_640125 [Halenospora varia]|nr:hypothetical protein B0J14DRAFT_640125 [Halenospora varia]
MPRPQRRVQNALPKVVTAPAPAPASAAALEPRKYVELPPRSQQEGFLTDLLPASSQDQFIKFTSRTCKRGVQVHRADLYQYSRIAREKVENIKKERDGSRKYRIRGWPRDEVAISLFANWLHTQTLDSYLTHSDSLIIQSVAGDERRSKEVNDKQELMAQLWMIANEFEIQALQNVTDVQLRRLTRKYQFLSPFVILYEDDYLDSSELQAICTDIWSCLLLSKEDGIAPKDLANLRKDLARTDMEDGAQEQVLAEVVAVMLERCSRPENIWDRDDGADDGGNPSSTDQLDGRQLEVEAEKVVVSWKSGNK